jgi:Secretion system C-terminal sorting domain
MKKQLLIVLTFFIIGLSLNAQTIFNNYSPDRLLSSSYTIRTIDLDNNGTDDFRFHFDFDTVAGESTIYLETFDENEILIHNINSLPPPLFYSPAIITTNVIMALHPSLANVDPLLPAEILSTLGDTAYWSSSSSINHNALIFFSTPNAGGLTITFGMSISACYDNYYCRVKQPGANNYIYGYIQAWGAASPPPLYEPWLYVGGTGYNPTINQTAVINTACTVVTNFEPGPQVGELPTGIFNLSKNTIFSVYPNPANSQINVKVDAKLLGSVYIVYDNVGKVVLSGKINSINTIIELGNLSGGIYLFSVGDNLKQTLKIIKE